MAKGSTYLVPVDFSKTSEIALSHAMKLARENKAKLVLLHVVSDSAWMAAGDDVGSAQVLLDYIKAAEKNAAEEMRKLVRRKGFKPGGYRSVLIRGGEPASVIARQAKKSRASMIVMGSHGRTGFRRFVLGSVAERTLRYAECPVLIVKK